MPAKISITSSKNYTKAEIYGFDSNSPTVRKMGSVDNIENNVLTLEVPNLTVFHIVLYSTSVQTK